MEQQGEPQLQDDVCSDIEIALNLESTSQGKDANKSTDQEITYILDQANHCFRTFALIEINREGNEAKDTSQTNHIFVFDN